MRCRQPTSLRVLVCSFCTIWMPSATPPTPEAATWLLLPPTTPSSSPRCLCPPPSHSRWVAGKAAVWRVSLVSARPPVIVDGWRSGQLLVTSPAQTRTAAAAAAGNSGMLKTHQTSSSCFNCQRQQLPVRRTIAACWWQRRRRCKQQRRGSRHVVCCPPLATAYFQGTGVSGRPCVHVRRQCSQRQQCHGMLANEAFSACLWL